MSPEISERSFEEAIECGLLQHGADDASGVRETPVVLPGRVPGRLPQTQAGGLRPHGLSPTARRRGLRQVKKQLLITHL